MQQQEQSILLYAVMFNLASSKEWGNQVTATVFHNILLVDNQLPREGSIVVLETSLTSNLHNHITLVAYFALQD